MKAKVEKHKGNPIQAKVVITLDNTEGASVTFVVYDARGNVALHDKKWMQRSDQLIITLEE